MSAKSYLVTVELLVQADDADQARERVAHALGAVSDEVPFASLLDWRTVTAMAVPEEVDDAITDGTYRDGQAFAHDRVAPDGHEGRP